MKTGGAPLVSVVIPTYNRARLAARAAASAFGQTHGGLEVIVVDDGSSDDTEKAVKSLGRARYLAHPSNMGASAARNTGAREAAGEFVAFLDSDDVWLPGHLERKLQVLASSGAGGVYGDFFVRRGRGRVRARLAPRRSSEPMADYVVSSRGGAHTSTFVFRKNLFLEVLFDPSLRKYEDWDLAIRFDRLHGMAFDPEPTMLYAPDTADSLSRQADYGALEAFLGRNAGFFGKNELGKFYARLALEAARREGRSPRFERYLERAGRNTGAAEFRYRMLILLLSRPCLRVEKLHEWSVGFRKRFLRRGF